MHVGGDDEIGHLRQHVLAHGQELGDDAGDLAARGERGAGHLSHEAQSAAAVDEADAVLRQRRAERARGFRIGGIGAFARAAINAELRTAVARSRVWGRVCMEGGFDLSRVSANFLIFVTGYLFYLYQLPRPPRTMADASG